jgi:hypothetical protein
VQAAIKDGKQPADIFKACMEAMDKKGTRDARHADASVLTGIPPSNGADDENEFSNRLKKQVQAKVKSRNRVTVHSRN